MPLVTLIATGGAFVLALLVFQMVTGMRWIKLGRNHLKIHKTVAWVIIASAVGHAAVALYVYAL